MPSQQCVLLCQIQNISQSKLPNWLPDGIKLVLFGTILALCISTWTGTKPGRDYMFATSKSQRQIRNFIGRFRVRPKSIVQDHDPE